jgi:hypothetical protein
MSCLGPGYNPNPARAWSRVQNPCSYSLEAPFSFYNPETGQQILFQQEVKNMLQKGNVLQYKKNSSGLTKKQRYSQIAKGMWTNRTKTWASQTQTSTNPNTNNLARVSYDLIPLPVPTLNPNGCIETYYKDGGILLGNTIVNPCTDEVIQVTKTNNCYPSTCSDVPGPETLLCWDPRVQTWYPRQRLYMNNSGNKWPYNYKLFKSANDLVSGTEVSLDIFEYALEVPVQSSLNGFDIANIYSQIVAEQDLVDDGPVYLDLGTTLTKDISFGVSDSTYIPTTYEEVNLNIDYEIPRSNIYILQNASKNINLKLPEKIPNLTDVTIINKSKFGINIITYDPSQKINNMFFSRDDNLVSLSRNNTAKLTFVVTSNTSDWNLNLF